MGSHQIMKRMINNGLMLQLKHAPYTVSKASSWLEQSRTVHSCSRLSGRNAIDGEDESNVVHGVHGAGSLIAERMPPSKGSFPSERNTQ